MQEGHVISWTGFRMACYICFFCEITCCFYGSTVFGRALPNFTFDSSCQTQLFASVCNCNQCLISLCSAELGWWVVWKAGGWLCLWQCWAPAGWHQHQQAAACATACAIPGATCLPDCLHPSLPYLVILSFQIPIFYGFSRHVIAHRDEKGLNKYFWKQSTPGLPSWCLHPPLTLCLPDTCPVPWLSSLLDSQKMPSKFD